MVNHLFGNYLVNAGIITAEQLEQAFELQKKVRVKLGLIAVAEKLMTTEQSEEVNRLQSVMDKRFGDIAVSKGYLTDEQVGRLLGLQGNPYLSFANAITESGYMTLEQFEAAFADYQKSLEFTATDMEAIKSGDSDRIIPLFLPEIDNMQLEHVLMAFRTFIRLIDSDAYIGKGSIAASAKTNGVALQSLDGDKKATLCFAGEGDALLTIANPFAKEEFETVDLDALDAVAEFINCINGMYATKVAPSLNVDMLPPSYKDGVDSIASDAMLMLPIYVKGKEVLLLSKFDGEITL